MEVALTFGSLGDIIQICQLAIQLGRAVGVGYAAAGGASTREYQQLRQDLDVFVRVLMQVVATYQQHEVSPRLQVLDDVSKSVVDECASLIQDTLQHLRSRYGNCLGVEGSGNKIKDIYKRIEWSVRETQRLDKLRAKLQEGVQRLSLLTSLATGKSARVDNATVLARIDQVQQLASQARSGQAEILEFLKKQRGLSEDRTEKQMQRLGQVNRQLAAQERGSRTILAVAKDAFHGIAEVKRLLLQVSHGVIGLQVSASNSIFIRPLDPTKGVPVILEDALGRPLEIPAQWIDTLEWEVLYGLLTGCFKGHKGHDMVQRQDYALEESTTGLDLDTCMPLSRSLRRGMKINMSMIFYSTDIVVGACPRCHAVTDAAEDVNVQCRIEGCGMWFRMQKQVINLSNLQPTAEQGGGGSSKMLREEAMAVTSIPAAPGDFQRVRLRRQYEPPTQPDAQGFDPKPVSPPAPGTSPNDSGDSLDAEPQASQVSESPQSSVPTECLDRKDSSPPSNIPARAAASPQDKHCRCTTNIYTYIYPDGHSETITRPVLCHKSRRGVPCSKSIVFQHPPSYIPYGFPPLTMTPPVPAPVNYSAPPFDQPFYPVTPGQMPCPAAPRQIPSEGYNADTSVSLPRSGNSPRKTRSHGSSVYVSGNESVVYVDDQNRYYTAPARRHRRDQRFVVVANDSTTDRRTRPPPPGTRNADSRSRQIASRAVVVPPRTERGSEEEAQRRRLMERMMPRRAAVEPARQRRASVAYADGVYWE